jgi:hypothetical protein
MKSELGKRLQTAIDAPGVKSPAKLAVWHETDEAGGYLDERSGLHYREGEFIKGHKNPRRRKRK